MPIARSRLNAVFETLIVAALYVATGQLGFSLAISPGNVTAVWPPAGLAVAAILRRGASAWFGIWLGSFIVNTLFLTKVSSSPVPNFAIAFTIATGSTLQAISIAYLLRKKIEDSNILSRSQDAFLFIAVSCICSVIAATLGVSSLYIAGFIPWTHYGYTWLTWWAGDVEGILVFAPLIITWQRIPSFMKNTGRMIEFVIFMILLTGVCYLLFGDSYIGRAHYPLLFCVFPILVWAAGRFGISGVTITVAMVEIFVVFGMKNGYGPIVLNTPNESLLLLAVFMASLSLIGLTFATVLNQWQNAKEQLENTAQELESKVLARTTELKESNLNLLSAHEQLKQRSVREIDLLNKQLEEEVADLELLNRQLQDTRDQALQASSLKSAFVANISHELRTPLSAIMAVNELLLSQQDLNPDNRELVLGAQQCAQSLRTLVGDLLDLARIESGKFSIEQVSFNPISLTQDVAGLFLNAAHSKHLVLNVHVDPHLPNQLTGDPGRIRQVLQNLLSNSLKFTTAGEVRLEVEHKSDSEIKFSVKDTGIGISDADQKLLFVPFSQVDNSPTRQFGGAGLGLALCKNLVELMGGMIGVESKEGQGSVFWFTIPLRSGHALNFSPETATQLRTIEAFRSRLVLVVEDNPVMQKLVVKQLTSMGLQVRSASNGREALDTMARQHFDLVLMDCNLPDISGLQVTTRIRELEVGTNAHVPIIAMTAAAMKGDEEKCLAAGMDDYMSKPVSINQLMTKLQQWLITGGPGESKTLSA